jgi:phosphatidylserine decarboxylase
MKYAGIARKACLKLLLISLVIAGAIGCGVWFSLPALMATPLAISVAFWWLAFVLFTVYFFRDPEAKSPQGANLVLAPGHGKVDVIDTTSEPQFMGGDCQRVSIFLSVFDVHVQNAPVGGKIGFYKYTTGQFLNAMKTESATFNENALIGFETTDSRRVGVRLIAGLIARRIIPFISLGEEVTRGQRVSLIQFGSRADVYLPRNAKVSVKLGDHVVGGETVLATLE